MSRQNDSQRGVLAEAEPISESWAISALPRREPGAHKWGVGGVVIVAGSPLYAGAAALCCAAAGRSGAGIVSAAVPRSIAPLIVSLVPEVTIVALPEGDSVSIAQRAADAVGARLARSQAMVIGPGLGDDESTAALLGAIFGFARVRSGIGFGAASSEHPGDGSRELASPFEKPAVVDADGLNWLAGQASWWERVPEGMLVLTPHPGEMARLIDGDVEQILADPMGTARDAAMRWGQTVVLKGNPTIVAKPDGTLRFAETPPALGTAGSGDVLSGSLGAFLAQGLGPADAAAMAVFAGGRAAARAADEYGTLGVVAGDLPAAIARELRDLEAKGA